MLYSGVHFRTYSFSLLSFWCWGPEESRSGGQSFPVPAPALCGGTFASRIEPFLGTSVYFCSRAGCPMPRFLTTNRTSGRAYWFPPGFQTPLHISLGFPSPASKGNIWSPFCFAVTAGTSEALQGDSFGAAMPLARASGAPHGHARKLSCEAPG